MVWSLRACRRAAALVGPAPGDTAVCRRRQLSCARVAARVAGRVMGRRRTACAPVGSSAWERSRHVERPLVAPPLSRQMAAMGSPSSERGTAR